MSIETRSNPLASERVRKLIRGALWSEEWERVAQNIAPYGL